MLRQKLVDDQLLALKSRDTFKLNTLRFILAQIKNKEIDKKTELNDEETVVVLRKFVKELKESIDAFQKANRQDLIADSQKQLDMVLAYLPAELTDEELSSEIKKIIDQNQAVIQKNPKAIIGVVMKALKGKADGERIMKILNIL